MQKTALTCALLVLSFSTAAGAATEAQPARDDEKVFFYGFERDKILANWLKACEDTGDTCHLIWPGDRGRCTQAIKKGDASEGQWAAVVDIGTGSLQSPNKGIGKIGNYDRIDLSTVRWDWFRPGYLANIAAPEQFTEVAEKLEWTGFSSYGGRLEHSDSTHSLHAKFYTRYDEGGVKYTPEAFPTDWRGHSFLRMDVKPEKGQLSLRMACEDDKVAPPVEKRFVVPAGKWATLEVDLDEAVRERHLDLSKIVSFWVFMEEISAPSLVYFDNLRLAKQGVATALPVIKGGPRIPRPTAPMPQAARENIKPERGKVAWAPPVKLLLKTKWDKPVGAIRVWAYDNSHLLLDAEYAEMHQSADGGAHWLPLARKFELPGGISSNAQAASGMDEQGNVLFFGNCGACIYHCAPPVDSMYFRKLVFNGDKWAPSPLYIVGGETRGCSQGRRLTTLPGGRIWVAYRVHERPPLGMRIHAQYSDDGGMTWRGAGVQGALTGTLADTLVGGPSEEGSGERKLFCDPLAIVPYGEHVAVLWGKWSYFDGQRWSQPQPVGAGPLKRPLRYFSAVGCGTKNSSFMLSTNRGLLTWDGAGWKEDESVKEASLSVCHSAQTVKVVGFSVENKGGGSGLLFWRRLADAKWASKEIAAEELPIGFGQGNEGDGFLAVPVESPADYVPVAWTCRGQKWVKTLRVPVE